MDVYAKRALLSRLSRQCDGTAAGFLTKLESEADRLSALGGGSPFVTSSSANGSTVQMQAVGVRGHGTDEVLRVIQQAVEEWPLVVTDTMTTAKDALAALLASKYFVVIRGTVSNFQGAML